MDITKNKIVLFFSIFIVLMTGLTGCESEKKVKQTEITSEVIKNDQNTVIWKVYDDTYAQIWQGSLNKLLQKKGKSYRVKIEAFDSIYGETKKETYANIFKSMKSENEPADVISIPANGSNMNASKEYIFTYPYREAVENEIVIPLNTYLESESGKKLVEKIHPVDYKRSELNGKIYGISQHMRQVKGIAYNKEYLEKYNIDVSQLSTNILDNLELLERIKNGEKGKVIPYYYSGGVGDCNMWQIFEMGAITYNAQKKNFINIFENEKFISYMSQLYDLKKNGLAESDYVPHDNFFAVAVTTHTNESYETTYQFINKEEEKIEKKVVVIPDMSKPSINLNWGDSANGIAAWSENKDNAFDFLSMLYTDSDIANLIQYGNEGEDYIKVDGRVKYTEESTLNVFAENFTNPLITYSQQDMPIDKRKFLDLYYKTCEADMPDGFRIDIESVKKEISALNTIFDSEECFSYLTLGAKNPESALSKIKHKLKEAGISKVIIAMQSQLEEWLNEK